MNFGIFLVFSFFLACSWSIPISDGENRSINGMIKSWMEFEQRRLMQDFENATNEQIFGQKRGDRRKRELTRLRYKDCGKVNRAIHFERLSVKPIPIQVPGLLDLRIKANVTRKLPPVLDVRVVLKKKFDKNWIQIPCIQEYGSCHYSDLKTCTLTQDVFGCPVKRGLHDIDEKFIIPDPGDALLSQMLEGEYKAIVRARHPLKKKELACLVAHFSLKNKSVPARRPPMYA